MQVLAGAWIRGPVAEHLRGPVEACIQGPVEACIQGPVEACIQGPVEACIQGPVEACIQGPVEAFTLVLVVDSILGQEVVCIRVPVQIHTAAISHPAMSCLSI